MKLLLTCFLAPLFCLESFAQEVNYTFEGDLPRRAHLGFKTKPVGSMNLYDAKELAVHSLEMESAAYKSNLREGDIIISINERLSKSALDSWEQLRNLPGGDRVKLVVKNSDKEKLISFIPKKEPLENLEGVHTTYGALSMDDGTKLRTILTRPINTTGPLPAILISDWTTCSSIEVPMRFQRGWINFLRGVIQTTGAIVLRVDKPGCGDSLGLCSELDFNETIKYQKKALKILKSLPDVDQNNIFIDGESVGGFIAPLVASNENIKGIFVRAAGATTWFERMVMFERKLREYSGKPLYEIDDDMKRITDFFHYYLIQSLPLGQIFELRPDLEEVWQNEISHNSSTKHYGRPIEFHQQAQSYNFAQAWIESGARGLVLYGSFDQYESEKASMTLVNAINSVNPGYGKLIVYPNLNHDLEYFNTRIDALPGYAGTPVLAPPLIGSDKMVKDVRKWMNALIKKNE